MIEWKNILNEDGRLAPEYDIPIAIKVKIDSCYGLPNAFRIYPARLIYESSAESEGVEFYFPNISAFRGDTADDIDIFDLDNDHHQWCLWEDYAKEVTQ